MDPVTFGMTFASIVSLLGMWKNEVDERKAKDLAEYLEWLRRKEHTQLVDLIEGNSELSDSLRGLVEDQHGHVMGELRKLEQVMVDVARNLAEFQPLADVMAITSGLSDQARSVLHQINEADATLICEDPLLSGPEYTLDYGSETLRIDEPRFIDSDLETLVELGLLLLGSSDSGYRVFKITRPGAAVGG